MTLVVEFEEADVIHIFIILQGLPSGFDIMYLALADTSMVVRFGLKVVWES